MSSLIYPIGIVSSLKRKAIRPVLKDTFEGGGSKTRSNFPDKYFLHQIEAMHPLLSHVEIEELVSFHQQMNGTQDTFILRDNSPRRTGNHIVRFADDIEDIQTRLRNNMGVRFEQADAAQPLPGLYEIEQAAGSRPFFCYDANRELYKNHLGTFTTDSDGIWDVARNYRAPWASGSLSLGDSTSLRNHFDFNASRYAQTASNISASHLTGAQPGFTIFSIVRSGTSASNKDILMVGAYSSNNFLTLRITSANQFAAITGGAGGVSVATNSPVDTWHSVAARWVASSDNNIITFNGTDSSAGTRARSYSAGPITMGANHSGTANFDGDVAVVMGFASELSNAQIQALHNLFGPMYGIAAV